MGVPLQALRLPKQQELGEANEFDRLRQLSTRRLHGRAAPPNDLGWPLEVACAVVSRLQGAEQGVVLEPEPVVLAELFIGWPEVRTGPIAEAAPRRLEQVELERHDLLVLDGACRECVACAISGPQQLVFDQGIRADQQLVAGER